MSCIHYKFKNSLDYETLPFDGLHISVAELKRAIFEKTKSKSTDSDLQITDARTKEEYKSESALIPRNTSVIIARVPASLQQKLPKVWNTSTEGVVGRKDASKLPDYSLRAPEGAEAGDDDLTEEQKLAKVMFNSTIDYQPVNYKKRGGVIMGGVAPPGYTCNRCGQSGHWINHCTNPKLVRGVPREELEAATAEHPYSYQTASGQYVINKVHEEARKNPKKEKPPFLPPENEPEIAPVVVDLPDVPEHLLCSICGNMLGDAVLINCCGTTFCDECIRQRLLECALKCPVCHTEDVSPDNLVPNGIVRKMVADFKKNYDAAKRGAAVSAIAAAAERAASPEVNLIAIKRKEPVTKNEPVRFLTEADRQSAQTPPVAGGVFDQPPPSYAAASPTMRAFSDSVSARIATPPILEPPISVSQNFVPVSSTPGSVSYPQLVVAPVPAMPPIVPQMAGMYAAYGHNMPGAVAQAPYAVSAVHAVSESVPTTGPPTTSQQQPLPPGVSVAPQMTSAPTTLAPPGTDFGSVTYGADAKKDRYQGFDPLEEFKKFEESRRRVARSSSESSSSSRSYYSRSESGSSYSRSPSRSRSRSRSSRYDKKRHHRSTRRRSRSRSYSRSPAPSRRRRYSRSPRSRDRDRSRTPLWMHHQIDNRSRTMNYPIDYFMNLQRFPPSQQTHHHLPPTQIGAPQPLMSYGMPPVPGAPPPYGYPHQPAGGIGPPPSFAPRQPQFGFHAPSSRGGRPRFEHHRPLGYRPRYRGSYGGGYVPRERDDHTTGGGGGYVPRKETSGDSASNDEREQRHGEGSEERRSAASKKEKKEKSEGRSPRKKEKRSKTSGTSAEKLVSEKIKDKKEKKKRKEKSSHDKSTSSAKKSSSSGKQQSLSAQGAVEALDGTNISEAQTTVVEPLSAQQKSHSSRKRKREHRSERRPVSKPASEPVRPVLNPALQTGTGSETNTLTVGSVTRVSPPTPLKDERSESVEGLVTVGCAQQKTTVEDEPNLPDIVASGSQTIVGSTLILLAKEIAPGTETLKDAIVSAVNATKPSAESGAVLAAASSSKLDHHRHRHYHQHHRKDRDSTGGDHYHHSKEERKRRSSPLNVINVKPDFDLGKESSSQSTREAEAPLKSSSKLSTSDAGSRRSEQQEFRFQSHAHHYEGHRPWQKRPRYSPSGPLSPALKFKPVYDEPQQPPPPQHYHEPMDFASIRRRVSLEIASERQQETSATGVRGGAVKSAAQSESPRTTTMIERTLSTSETKAHSPVPHFAEAKTALLKSATEGAVEETSVKPASVVEPETLSATESSRKSSQHRDRYRAIDEKPTRPVDVPEMESRWRQSPAAETNSFYENKPEKLVSVAAPVNDKQLKEQRRSSATDEHRKKDRAKAKKKDKHAHAKHSSSKHKKSKHKKDKRGRKSSTKDNAEGSDPENVEDDYSDNNQSDPAQREMEAKAMRKSSHKKRRTSKDEKEVEFSDDEMNQLKSSSSKKAAKKLKHQRRRSSKASEEQDESSNEEDASSDSRESPEPTKKKTKKASNKRNLRYVTSMDTTATTVSTTDTKSLAAEIAAKQQQLASLVLPKSSKQSDKSKWDRENDDGSDYGENCETRKFSSKTGSETGIGRAELAKAEHAFYNKANIGTAATKLATQELDTRTSSSGQQRLSVEKLSTKISGGRLVTVEQRRPVKLKRLTDGGPLTTDSSSADDAKLSQVDRKVNTAGLGGKKLSITIKRK